MDIRAFYIETFVYKLTFFFRLINLFKTQISPFSEEKYL